MTIRPIHELDSSLHEANTWLKDVMQHLGTDDAHTGHTAMRASLHALRDLWPADVQAEAKQKERAEQEGT